MGFKLAETIQQPEGSTEVVAQRREGSKTFHLGGDKYRFIRIPGKVHYKEDYSDKKEQWKEIDLKAARQEKNYIVDKAPYILEVFTDKIGFSYTSRKGGNVIVNLIAIGGQPLDEYTLSLKPKVVGREIHFDDMLANLDMFMEMRSAKCEIFKVLKDSTAPTEFEWEFIVDDPKNRLGIKKMSAGIDNQKRPIKMSITKGLVDKEKYPGKDYFTIKEKFEGQVAIVIDLETRVKTWSDEIDYPVKVDMPEIAVVERPEYPVKIDADITENIVTNWDDVYDYWTGTTFNRCNPVEETYNIAGLRGQMGAAQNKYMGVGWRFQTIGIPQGATIDGAVLKVKVKNFIYAKDIVAHIAADDVDDAAAFSNNAAQCPNQVVNVNPTNAIQVWNITTGAASTWHTLGGTGTGIKDIIQEIVSRPGWASGYDMRLAAWFYDGEDNYKHAVNIYDYRNGEGAILEIDFTAAAGAVAPTGALYGPLFGPMAGPI